MANVKGKLLLGWMEECEALHWLLEEFRGEESFTENSARELWQQYRDKVAALPPRPCLPPSCIAHRTRKERYEEERFTRKSRQNSSIIRVVKLDDPSKLVVHQLMVVLPKSVSYLADMLDPVKRVRICLGRGLEFKGTHPTARREGDVLIKPVPHAEFEPTIANQWDFELRERPRHIAVKKFEGRMLLHAGYHRAHISMYRRMPEDAVLPVFAALESDADAFFSIGSKLPFKRDMVRGLCPPLLGDFFDESLCIELPLRKCRVEICVDLITHKWDRLWPDAE